MLCRRKKFAARRRLRCAGRLVLTAFLALVFLSAIDGPVAPLSAVASAASCGKSTSDGQIHRAPSAGLGPSGVFQPATAAPPASYLRFDFKQNLCCWPVLAGEIRRSPPFPAASRNPS